MNPDIKRVSQNWCPLFPGRCPFAIDAEQLDSCPTKAIGEVSCTLERLGAPQPVANGLVVRSGLPGQIELLLIRRRTGIATQPGRWGLPGGRLLAGESVEAAVCREVLEETGWRVRVIAPTAIPAPGGVELLEAVTPFVVRPEAASWDDPNAYVGFFCECQPLGEAPVQRPCDPKVVEARWFTSEALVRMIEERWVTPLDSAVLSRRLGLGEDR